MATKHFQMAIIYCDKKTYKFGLVGILQCLWQIRKGPNVCKMCAQQLRLQNMSLNQHGSDAWSSDSKSSDNKKISDESSDKNSDWVCWAFPARTLWSALAFSRVLWIAKSTENFHYFSKVPSPFLLCSDVHAMSCRFQWKEKVWEASTEPQGTSQCAFPLLCIALHCIALQGTSQCAFPLHCFALQCIARN